ncbi:MAG: indolepyruvate ferredoxin oxidoreductase subunit beta [Euryarchaeota archaeon]|nr:indolepyruvate ferredoxin oxidoreductase subunit beta [Euryarchaeota archaeon]
MKYNIQLVGVGGQGVLLASTVLGNAAVSEGLEVAMSEVHGMAQRGGSVQCSVRFGHEIYSPLIPAGGADLLLGFEPAETLRNITSVSQNSFIITNTSPIIPISVSIGQGVYPPLDEILDALRSVNEKVIAIDATARAIEAGRAITANAVLIGAIAAVKGFPLSRQRVLDALLDAVPTKAQDVNIRAFDLGYNEVKDR